MSKRPDSGGAMSIARFAEELDGVSSSHRRDENFKMLIEAAYCMLAKRTTADVDKAAKLEARYMGIVARYQDDPGAMFRMSKLFGKLVMTVRDYDGDYLGSAYMSEEICLRSKPKGQFFTPYAIARMMATMLLGDKEEVAQQISEKGVLTINEPACGSGVMILAFAERLRELGFEVRNVMFAMLVDCDSLCMQIAFLQMWIHDIPAVCVHGNSLALEEFERAYTAAALRLRWPRKKASDMPSAETAEPKSTAEASPIDEKPTSPSESSRRKDVFEQGDLFGSPPTGG